MRLLLLLAFAALVPLVVGCGSSGPEMVPVTGTVKLETGPIPKSEVAIVTFEPADMSQRNLTGSSGDIQPDGSFRLKNNEGDGVRPGQYKAAIKIWGSYRPPHNSPIDEKYEKGATSPLLVTVKAGETNHFEWSLAPAAPAAAKK